MRMRGLMRRQTGKKSTFQDVARMAEVSVATVSRVATGQDLVSSEVTNKVKEAALSLGVNLESRSKTKVIGFLLSNRAMLHPFHSRLLAAAEAYCAAHEINILYLPIRYDATTHWRDLRLPRILLRRDLIYGFIAAGVNSQNLLDFLSHKKIRFNVLGNNLSGKWRHDAYDTVWIDDSGGAYEATSYLLSIGHRSIWFVGNCRLPWYNRRYEGYCRAMENAGLKPLLSDTDSEKDAEIGYLGAKSIVSQAQPATAIFAGGDSTALGVYGALRDAGRRIPDDISVMGFNDIEASMAAPPMTTVRVFVEEVGRQLAKMLISRIFQPELPPQRHTIPTQLVQRGSCQPPALLGDTRESTGDVILAQANHQNVPCDT